MPLSETIIPGLPRRSISVVSSRATRRRDRRVLDRCQAFARHVINGVEDPESPAAGQLVVDEIQRPAGIDVAAGSRRCHIKLRVSRRGA